jgi:hypothetical protein
MNCTRLCTLILPYVNQTTDHFCDTLPEDACILTRRFRNASSISLPLVIPEALDLYALRGEIQCKHSPGLLGTYTNVTDIDALDTQNGWEGIHVIWMMEETNQKRLAEITTGILLLCTILSSLCRVYTSFKK